MRVLRPFRSRPERSLQLHSAHIVSKITALTFSGLVLIAYLRRKVQHAARASSTSDEKWVSPSAEIRFQREMGRLHSRDMLSQEDLVDHLKSHRWLESENCVSAMLRVDRRDFVQQDIPPRLIYQDRPLPNGPTETISAPHMHATALQLLANQLRPGARILDVGSGSGYLTACFAYAAEPGAYVLGIEKFASLTEQSIRSLRAAHPKLLEDGIVEIQAANVLGMEAEDVDEEDKFAAIHVGAAAAVIPNELCHLLARGGRMVIPVGPQHGPQVLSIVDRVDPEDSAKPEFQVRDLMGVQYVPLTPPSDSDPDLDSDSEGGGAPAMHGPASASAVGDDGGGSCEAAHRAVCHAPADPAAGAAS